MPSENRKVVEEIIADTREIDDVPYVGRVIARALLDVADAIREHGQNVREAAGFQPKPPDA